MSADATSPDPDDLPLAAAAPSRDLDDRIVLFDAREHRNVELFGGAVLVFRLARDGASVDGALEALSATFPGDPAVLAEARAVLEELLASGLIAHAR